MRVATFPVVRRATAAPAGTATGDVHPDARCPVAPFDLSRMSTADADDAVMRAARVGVTAVWTGDCSGSVELARMTGPRDGLVTLSDARRLRLPGEPPWELSDPGVRATVYEYCLVSGTQFDVYRWVNLPDLAGVWPLLRLPDGVRHEWAQVLVAAGLLGAATDGWSQAN